MQAAGTIWCASESEFVFEQQAMRPDTRHGFTAGMDAEPEKKALFDEVYDGQVRALPEIRERDAFGFAGTGAITESGVRRGVERGGVTCWNSIVEADFRNPEGVTPRQCRAAC